MIVVKISDVLIEEGFQAGQKYSFEIVKGIPPGCKLIAVKFQESILEVYFMEPGEKIREFSIQLSLARETTVEAHKLEKEDEIPGAEAAR